MNDGKFELVVLKILTYFLLKLLRQYTTRIGDVEIISTDRANIKLHSPVSFQIDGNTMVERQN
jgi:diacylglycerol kinase family enzyme